MDFNLEEAWRTIEEEIEKVNKKFNVPTDIVIIGFGNSGKSTLFNLLFGENLQKTGAETDKTTKSRSKKKGGTIYTDTPGYGTKRFTVDGIKKELMSRHVIVQCLNGMSAISKDDVEIIEFCKEIDKPIILVVNKADVMEKDEIAQYKNAIEDKIGTDIVPLFISAKTGLNMNKVVQRIVELLPEAKRDAFLAKQQVDKEMKTSRARKYIHSAAVSAAAIAVTPIPVADILAIAPLQVSMVIKIGLIFGHKLEKANAKELIGTVAGGVVFRYAAQVLVKFVPGVGSVIGPVIAYGGTVAIGETAVSYFSSGMKLSKEELEEVYRSAKSDAEKSFKSGKRETTLKKNKEQIKQFNKDLKNGVITQDEFEKKIEKLS